MSSTPSPGSSNAELRSKRAALAVAAIALCGCATGQGAQTPRVAILPVDTIGVPGGEGRALRAALQRQAGRHAGVVPATAATVRAADHPRSAGRCHASFEDCLARTGRRVPAELVLSTTLAGLGELRVIRARLVRTRDALLLQDTQRVVPTARGRPAVLDRHAADLARRLFPVRRQRWYRKWWVWTAVGVVASGAVAAGVVLATRPQEDRDPAVVHLGGL